MNAKMTAAESVSVMIKAVAMSSTATSLLCRWPDTEDLLLWGREEFVKMVQAAAKSNGAAMLRNDEAFALLRSADLESHDDAMNAALNELYYVFFGHLSEARTAILNHELEKGGKL